jgi:hypothetical protein
VKRGSVIGWHTPSLLVRLGGRVAVVSSGLTGDSHGAAFVMGRLSVINVGAVVQFAWVRVQFGTWGLGGTEYTLT